MPAHQPILALLLLSSLSLSTAGSQRRNSNPNPNSPTAYEMLEQFNFPKGILPEGVQGYLLRPDGGFEVSLSSDCEFKVEGGGGGYLLRYKKKISGRVASGSLTELRGASVRILRFWFGIDEVVMRGGDLDFYVGPLSASYPAANFLECPRCLCGSDCGGADDDASSSDS